MFVRTVQENDYDQVIGQVDVWWGRPMSSRLPRLFFQHFQDTSFILDEDGRVLAFLIGLISQTHPEQAYIHFVGVHPEYRRQGCGRLLYERFFQAAVVRGCTEVRCVTSPQNHTSIKFHQRLGFSIVKGNKEIDGLSVWENDAGPGQDRVRFVRQLLDIPHDCQAW